MKLYYSPGACSLSVHIALREVGATFDPVRVDLASHTLAQDGADYRAISPRGYVPLLELEDGERYTESSALLQYVADLDPRATLIGGGNPKTRQQVIQWLSFIATELHKGFGPLWNKDIPESVKELAKKRLATRFQELDQRLANSPYLAGDFSVADAYAFTVLSWTRFLQLPLDGYPSLPAYLERVGARPHVRTALKEEGLTH
jgi:glutathione S-transferase